MTGRRARFGAGAYAWPPGARLVGAAVGADAEGLGGGGDEGLEGEFGAQERALVAIGGIGVEELGFFAPGGADVGFAGAHGQAEGEEGGGNEGLEGEFGGV